MRASSRNTKVLYNQRKILALLTWLFLPWWMYKTMWGVWRLISLFCWLVLIWPWFHVVWPLDWQSLSYWWLDSPILFFGLFYLAAKQRIRYASQVVNLKMDANFNSEKDSNDDITMPLKASQVYVFPAIQAQEIKYMTILALIWLQQE